jgi:hypothetical protein
MASGIYTNCKNIFLNRLITDDVSALLIDTTVYTPALTADASLADIPDAALLSEAAVTGKAVVDGEFFCDAITFSKPEANKTAGAVVLFFSKDTLSASKLIAYYDDSADLPFVTDGTDVVITVNASGSWIVL